MSTQDHPFIEVQCVPEQSKVFWRRGGTSQVGLLVTVCGKSPTESRPTTCVPHLLLVIDTSSSMRGEPLQNVKRALSVLLLELEPTTVVGLLAFNSRVRTRVNFDALDEVHRNRLMHAVRALESKTGTNLADALLEAFTWEPSRLPSAVGVASAPPHAVVLVLSDGMPSMGGAIDRESLSWLVKKHRPPGMTVSTFAYGASADTALLIGIARDGGGRYTAARNINAVAAGFQAECDLQRNVVARNVTVELSGKSRAPDAHSFIGDIVSGNRRTVVFDVPLHIASPDETTILANVCVRGTDPSGVVIEFHRSVEVFHCKEEKQESERDPVVVREIEFEKLRVAGIAAEALASDGNVEQARLAILDVYRHLSNESAKRLAGELLHQYSERNFGSANSLVVRDHSLSVLNQVESFIPSDHGVGAERDGQPLSEFIDPRIWAESLESHDKKGRLK